MITGIIGIIAGLALLTLLSVGLGIIANKKGYSVPLFIAAGILLGPGYFIATVISNKPFMAIPILLIGAIGVIAFLIGLCLPKKPKTEPKVTLPMPLLPG